MFVREQRVIKPFFRIIPNSFHNQNVFVLILLGFRVGPDQPEGRKERGEEKRTSASLDLHEPFREDSLADLFSTSDSFKNCELLNRFPELIPILFLIQSQLKS
jgi:hypothetical protein